MSKIDCLQTIDPPDRRTIERLPSAANENVLSGGGTHKPKRDPLWPMILIGFGVCLTLLWSAFLVWGAVKLIVLTLG